MLKEKYVSYYLVNVFLDALAACLSLVIAYFLRTLLFELYILYDLPFVTIPTVHSFKYYSWLFLIIIPMWPILMDINGAYSSYKFHSLRKVVWIILKSVAQATILLVVFLFVFKIEGISRIFIFLISGVSVVLLIVKEWLMRVCLLLRKKSDLAYRNILLIGTEEDCKKMASIFASYSFWGLRVLGAVAPESHKNKEMFADMPNLGVMNQLHDILVAHPIDEVVVASPVDVDAMQSIIEQCEELGVKTRIPLNHYHVTIAKPSLESFSSIPILTFTTTSTKVLDLFFKYMIDRILAFFFILLFSPLMLLIAVLIKLTSPGPILFSQTRVGLYGRHFNFYKFRSMYVNAEEKLAELRQYNEMQGPVFKMKNDPRITSIGKFIRKTSLDELPQFFNVLKGEMSIVGPRPPLPKEVEQYKPWQRRKLSMKPGITCIWQVSGRNQMVDFDNWMRMDLEYIDNWSLFLDFKLLVRTIYVVLTMHGAQ
ncbi:MAG: sugar transferase [Candidatus Auribacterota bacterium]